MKNAIWFSRHTPTAAQIQDAAQMGYVLTVTETASRLGNVDLANDGDVRAVASQLVAHCDEQSAVAIFGVFAAPMLHSMYATASVAVAMSQWDGILCFAAWNVMRSQEGGKPTFEHKSFVSIGRLG